MTKRQSSEPQPSAEQPGWRLRWPRGLRSPSQRERDTTLALIIALGVAGSVIVTREVGSPPAPAPTLAAVGGRVVSTNTPRPTAVPPTPSQAPAARSSPQPRASATLGPTPTPPAPLVADVVETPAIRPVAAEPTPATAPPSVLAAVQPADAVAQFYRDVTAADFDAAYALWSERMRATYPRGENLDGRFARTASITFDSLYVAEQSARTATVQANFTETYDTGERRQFIGYWRLVGGNGGWLLDEPHY